MCPTSRVIFNLWVNFELICHLLGFPSTKIISFVVFFIYILMGLISSSLIFFRRCIKWVQEAFPPGGDCSGLVVIYEQCVRAFWHDTRYKDDLRYLKVWLEYVWSQLIGALTMHANLYCSCVVFKMALQAENCVDSEVIFSFLDANEIGQTHAIFYISYAFQLEAKNKIKTANDIFNRGLLRYAPILIWIHNFSWPFNLLIC